MMTSMHNRAPKYYKMRGNYLEKYKRRLRELESSELGAKVVAVTRAEVLEEVWVHGAAVDEDGLDLVAGVGDLHPRDHEAVHLGAHAVQVDLHVEGGAGLHTQLVVNEGSVLANTHAQDGDGAVTGHLLDALDIVNSPASIIINYIFSYPVHCSSIIMMLNVCEYNCQDTTPGYS